MKKLMMVGILLMSLGVKSQILIEGIDINTLDSVKYVEMIAIEAGLFKSKLQIAVDYGQKIKWGTDARIQNSKGAVMAFNTNLHALNFFCNNGWEFVTTYAVSIPNGGSVYHYLLRRRKE